MKPLKLKGHKKGNDKHYVIYAKDQPQYLPLPAYKTNDETGTVIFCWGLSILERLKLLFTGKLWVSLLTFNNPLTPNRLSVNDMIKEIIVNK